MASAFTHAVFAATMGRTALRGPVPRRLWIVAIVLSILPDADVIGFLFGIRYGDFLGHRGFSHSLAFAAIAGTAAALLLFQGMPRARRTGLALFFAAVTASHGLLDALTNGGLGIAIFSPFDQTRYFLPWRPLPVSPVGLTAFLSDWGRRVILTEIVWIWIPCGVLLAASVLWRRALSRRSEPTS